MTLSDVQKNADDLFVHFHKGLNLVLDNRPKAKPFMDDAWVKSVRDLFANFKTDLDDLCRTCVRDGIHPFDGAVLTILKNDVFSIAIDLIKYGVKKSIIKQVVSCIHRFVQAIFEPIDRDKSDDLWLIVLNNCYTPINEPKVRYVTYFAKQTADRLIDRIDYANRMELGLLHDITVMYFVTN